tara:strand:+ start:5328 stop:5831 length:504 start_codon:yes stop_codon:yes gene_type:complete
MVKYLNEPRQLTPRELEIYGRAKTKWMPKIFTSFQTPVDQMMASPVKYSSINALFMIVVISAMLYIYTLLEEDAYPINVFNKFVLIALSILYLFIFGVTYFKTRRSNEDIIMVASYLPEGRIPSRYEIEASPVVQSKLLRSSIGNSGSGIGAGLVGGLFGGTIRRRK